MTPIWHALVYDVDDQYVMMTRISVKHDTEYEDGHDDGYDAHDHADGERAGGGGGGAAAAAAAAAAAKRGTRRRRRRRSSSRRRRRDSIPTL